MRAISIVGVPSSAGSYAAGQDQAPSVLRSAGLIDALSASGLEVHDEGDLPLQIWCPDRLNPLAQNVGEVTESIHELIERLTPLLARGDTLLVLGGNCTVALGVVASLRRVSADPVGVLYVDRNYDINTPESTTDGALDWMGMATHSPFRDPSMRLSMYSVLDPSLNRIRWHGWVLRTDSLPNGSEQKPNASDCT